MARFVTYLWLEGQLYSSDYFIISCSTFDDGLVIGLTELIDLQHVRVLIRNQFVVDEPLELDVGVLDVVMTEDLEILSG